LVDFEPQYFRMSRAISEQVVVVTGASSGVGRAIARAFGTAGAKVGLIARGMDGLEACAEEIRRAGGEALVLPADVSDAMAVRSAARTLVERWGRIDTWVNNAMVSVFSPAMEITPDEFRRVMEVDYLGTAYGTLAALRYMLPVDNGVVLQIGSALAYRSIPLQSAYCASKAAIRAFTDSLRCELLHDCSNVRLCMLQLPAVNTPQFDVVRTRLPRHPKPVPPIFQPEMIARAALHAAGHPSREIWVGWSAAKAILGQKFIGGLLDRYLARIGYEAQQEERPVRPDRPDNLWAPLPGDRGAHGGFDAQAKRRSVEVWLRLHRGKLATALATAALGLVALRALRA
jgi:NADP-dependent 3-hydroxy acid dehydrogenase YdfG